jgi:hypothetical protein
MSETDLIPEIKNKLVLKVAQFNVKNISRQLRDESTVS